MLEKTEVDGTAVNGFAIFLESEECCFKKRKKKKGREREIWIFLLELGACQGNTNLSCRIF